MLYQAKVGESSYKSKQRLEASTEAEEEILQQCKKALRKEPEKAKTSLLIKRFKSRQTPYPEVCKL